MYELNVFVNEKGRVIDANFTQKLKPLNPILKTTQKLMKDYEEIERICREAQNSNINKKSFNRKENFINTKKSN